MDCVTANAKDVRIAELEKQLAVFYKKEEENKARRAKLPLKKYVIHRSFSYDFVKTIEATSCREAKEIADATAISEMLNDKDWVCLKELSLSYKKKCDKPELVKDKIEEVVEEEVVEEEVKEQVEQVDSKKKGKKNKKKKNK